MASKNVLASRQTTISRQLFSPFHSYRFVFLEKIVIFSVRILKCLLKLTMQLKKKKIYEPLMCFDGNKVACPKNM